MNDDNKVIYDRLNKDINIPQSYLDTIYATFNKLPEKENIKSKVYKYKLSIATACCSLVLIAGCVFASEIGEFINNLFLASPVLVENGYIGKEGSDFVSNDATITINNNDIDTINSNVKIDNFIMDNNHLGLEFEIVFDEKISKYKEFNKNMDGNINYENFGNVEFTEMFIVDEENNLIYSPSYNYYNDKDREKFNSFCSEHSLNYTYQEFNENYFMCLSNSSIKEISDTPYSVKLDCNIASNNNFPKSEKLKIFIKEISFIQKLESNISDKTVVLSGEWIFDLEIPEIMYNREDVFYKVISCDNNDFEINNAKLSVQNLELDVTIKNIDPPIYPQEMAEIEELHRNSNNGQTFIPNTKEEIIKYYGDEKYVKLYEDFHKENMPINISGLPIISWESKKSDGTYLLTSNGKKVQARDGVGNFKYYTTYDENGLSKTINLNEYECNLIFDITPYEITDNINVIIDFKGEPVHIQLERVENNVPNSQK